MKRVLWVWLLVALVSLACTGNVYGAEHDKQVITLAYSVFNSPTESAVALNNAWTNFGATLNYTGLKENATTTTANVTLRFYDGDTSHYVSVGFKQNTTGWFATACVKDTTIKSSYAFTAITVAKVFNGTHQVVCEDNNRTRVWIDSVEVLDYVNPTTRFEIDKYDATGSAYSLSSGNAYVTVEEYGISFQIGQWIPMIIGVAMLGMVLGMLRKFRGR